MCIRDRIYSGYSDLEEKFKIDIKGTSESFIPDTRIQLQLLIDADGISYYLKSRIVPTAAKVDSALKHIFSVIPIIKPADVTVNDFVGINEDIIF